MNTPGAGMTGASPPTNRQQTPTELEDQKSHRQAARRVARLGAPQKKTKSAIGIPVSEDETGTIPAVTAPQADGNREMPPGEQGAGEDCDRTEKEYRANGPAGRWRYGRRYWPDGGHRSDRDYRPNRRAASAERRSGKAERHEPVAGFLGGFFWRG